MYTSDTCNNWNNFYKMRTAFIHLSKGSFYNMLNAKTRENAFQSDISRSEVKSIKVILYLENFNILLFAFKNIQHCGHRCHSQYADA